MFFDKWFRKAPVEATAPKESPPNKDPNDFCYTKCNSTEWLYQDRICPECFVQVSESQYRNKVCSSCGSLFDWYSSFRSRQVRGILLDGEWFIQVRYKNQKPMILSKEAATKQKLNVIVKSNGVGYVF